tara:strand:- start:323 stop:814 length:492 start_codon:yes stop_codon:yes gene_type:complete
MLFAEIATGKAKTKVQLEQENKNMSLPSSWTDATLDALGVASVVMVAKPEVNEWQVAVKDGVEQVDGVWREKWVVQEMFTEYTDGEGNTITVQAQKDAKTAADNAALAASERSKRDELLKVTDHYGLSDVTMSSEMATYRQALRNVPQQAGFPNNITWPTLPS